MLWSWPAVYSIYKLPAVHHQIININEAVLVMDEIEYENSYLVNLKRGHNRRSCEQGKEAREYFTEYFTGEGAVSWQNERINQG